MALNTLLAVTINGKLNLVFGSQADAEKKLSLAVSFPEWLCEVTEGKGSKKKIIGYNPTEFSKRAISSVEEFSADDMPDRHFLKAIDSNLSGLRGQLGKIGITDLRSPGSSVTHEMDEHGTRNYSGCESVSDIVSILSSVFTELTPTAGSLADPTLEAKKIFAKSTKFEDLNYDDPQSVFKSWKERELERINRVMEKAEGLSAEEFKSYCQEKFLANGVDEKTGLLKLKGSKDKEGEE